MTYVGIAIASIAAILLYLLVIATGNTSALEDYYWWIFALNILLLLALLAVVSRQILRLRQQIKHRVFGAKLTQKLASMFVLVALVPGVLIFTISAQFLTKSIESWFDIKVDTALDRGLGLGRKVLDFSLLEVKHKSQLAVEALQTVSDEQLNPRLEHLREKLNVQDLSLFDRQGRLIARATTLKTSPPPPLLDEFLRTLSIQRMHDSVEDDGLNGLTLNVFNSYNNSDHQVRILRVLQNVPDDIAKDAHLMASARTEYSSLLISRKGLKTFYMLTLALAFLLALGLALAFALFLSERLSAPLLELATATRAVAQGDFSKRQPVYRRDELGMLTAMFNRMTEQLDEAKQIADEHQLQLENGKLYLESILANLSAGVMAFDAQWHVRSVNNSAERILNVHFQPLLPLAFNEWPTHSPALLPLVEAVLQEATKMRHKEWQAQIEYDTVQGKRVLLVRGGWLAEEEHNGFVVVFDDITNLARAQRDAAWGEVAKRLAHEIRNPLTPIQLSAERLAMKLVNKLEAPEADIVRRATQTIIKQVAALKSMVDAFRDYARSPHTILQSIDINEVIREVMMLYESNAAVKIDLYNGPLKIMGDGTLLRQLVHNLIQNAQDAVIDVLDPMIQISSRLEGKNVSVCVLDNGPGFDAAILPQAFEPYVTNKPTGTGLGLAVVKKIIEEHHGQILLENAEHHGARILLTLPLLEA